ncbi:MAG TPA: N(4)-(beta-N-acetylglucosaminyl)-L-asparaginase [Blastocatellia bacterium]|nr:N(4)-(beta-N-acetylglucosaminyl)-L-asparaginase [Blastocatellia bacterium]HMX29648.1 N(4)-(beta-N-acetylglucosaminyl)-L-asparaginase [Blastocatellia bacterium]HMY75525.1 N(4)-(beta-N-acetylglucosaminyl)-L-asparaginase [Blastocatellia bacterium]HMZ18342.1 N(4)-(beta-N-acetylglucosaminyl)-L-asparaginase [Blastocatellia bacterium]HNG28669.1 N(4)-(beta-N-acetylglucosaminyl)-L-asparaginase [Blastocatellia bacterium]
MSNEENGNNSVGRRNFLRGAALAGVSAPLLAGETMAAPQSAKAIGKARPVVISSANINKGPDGSVFNGGIDCVSKAMEILKRGGDTLEAVVAGVNIVESDPRDNSVGYGGLPNAEGDVELDSCCMHGPSRRAGSVASIRHIKNPASVAKLVLERTDHIMLVGEGAMRFALAHGFKKEDLLTEDSRKIWLKWKEEMSDDDAWGPSPKHPHPASTSSKKIAGLLTTPADVAFNEWAADVIRRRPTGTINCLAVDANGDISGVTTTSGLAWKIPGRVGDSPVIGAGLYVDNEVGAAGSTGRGEENIYICGGHTIVENMRRGMNPTEAALDVLKRISHRYGDNQTELAKFNITFYAVNKAGEYGAANLWGGGKFAVHDGTQAKVLDTAYLYEKKK